MWTRGRGWIEKEGEKEQYGLTLSKQETLWVVREVRLLTLKGGRENTGFLEL